MIAWPIQAAKASGCFERLIVSTDDPEIASIAISLGAEVPFLRPAELSGDYAGTREVVQHAAAFLGDFLSPGDHICCIYASSPFVMSADLIQSKTLLESSRRDAVVFAATTFSFPIQRAVRLDTNGYVLPIDPQSAAMRSQDLEEVYHDAGQFYWASVESWNRECNLFDGARPFMLARWRVQDIDTEEDWKRAELMHAVLSEEIEHS